MLAPVLDRHDVMIYPTLAIPSVKAEHDPEYRKFRINGKRVDPYVGWYMT